ncbi:cytochrome P450 [Spinellus fusiger]|nr:cytochrome P450 [Spinellus fusiger]
MDIVKEILVGHNNKSTLQKFGVAGGAAVAITALLALKYPNRAIFEEYRENIVYMSGGLPIVGQLVNMLKSTHRMHDFRSNLFENIDALTGYISVLGMPSFTMTIDPRNVEHILKTNFENYVKSKHFSYSVEHLLGHGIFNANGEQWKWQRKAASHIFNVKNFRDHFTDVFISHMDTMRECILDKAVISSEPIDFHDAMYRYTLDSFVLIGFGVRLDALKTSEVVPFAESFDACQEYSFEKLINPFSKWMRMFREITRPNEKTVDQHIKTVDGFASDVINARRQQNANGEEHTDLLSRFMKAKNEKGETLNNKELRDTILNFIIAGRDTTAQALSWQFYNIALNPDVEKKLLDEINNHINDENIRDSALLYEVVKNMIYAQAVFYETLRLYPSVPGNNKFALKDDVWPDGTHIRKGDHVIWSLYAMGRSPALWGEDAKVFKPERWITPEGTLRRESFGLWPAFHGGPRICLGQNLATLEALVATIFLLKHYKFTMLPGQDITYRATLTLAMENGLNMHVEKR